MTERSRIPRSIASGERGAAPSPGHGKAASSREAQDGGRFVLAIDTSTALASVALYDGGVCGELTWRSGRNHSTEVMIQVDAMLRLCRAAPDQLLSVAVAVGPGSYTGLRVGLAAAKGLSLAVGIPMVGVCTLDILAAAQRSACLPVRPLLDAGRNRFATALYANDGGEMVRLSPVEGRRLPEVVESISERTLLCGDVDEDSVLGLVRDIRLLELASPASSLRRSGYLAEIGWRRYHRGEVQNPAEVTAIYLSGEEA